MLWVESHTEAAVLDQTADLDTMVEVGAVKPIMTPKRINKTKLITMATPIKVILEITIKPNQQSTNIKMLQNQQIPTLPLQQLILINLVFLMKKKVN